MDTPRVFPEHAHAAVARLRHGLRPGHLAVPMLLALLLASAAPPSRALAQGAIPQQAPSPANLVPQGSPIDRERVPTPPSTSPGLVTPTPPPAANFAPGQAVRIGSVGVNGSTVYPPAELAALTEGLTGPAVPLSRVEQARQDLLARYRRDGFLLTSVSTALDARGNLRINVVEGYIADVRLQGDIGPAGLQVLRFLRRLLDEKPIRISTLERYLLLATDVPGVTMRSVLRPSADDPAAVTLIAQVSRKAVDGLLAVDNRAFRQTGPEQMLAVGTFNSFSQFGERTEVSILHSFNNTQTFGQAATEFFVGGSGLKVRLYAGAGGTNPSGPLRELGYDGRTRVFGIQASYPFIRSRQQTLIGTVQLDALESDISTDGGPPDALDRPTAVRASFDSLRILRGGADYAIQDLLLGGDRTGVNNISVRLSKGLHALGASSNNEFLPGRVGSKTDFVKFNAEISRSQLLFRPWSDSSLVLYGLIAGQVSNGVLPPAEKFFLGGIRYSRGFYAGEVTGDNALTGTVELQLNTTIPVNAFGVSGSLDPQFYVFHDWGESWENRQEDPNRTLRSYGGGVRAQVSRFVAMEVEGVSRRTTRPSVSANVSALKAEAVYWRLLTRF